MSVRIALNSPPEFYTNLDVISGKVVLGINRPEAIGAVIVKLEGESKTALGTPDTAPNNVHPQSTPRRRASAADSSQIVQENHKVLYKVQQIFPDESVPAYSVPVYFQPGQHEWKFNFKVPFNNTCGNPEAMAKIGGLAGAGGFAGPSLFGVGGIRLMDGSKQLFYQHVTKTLPPSFTGFPRQAEIRYYIKVTIQRPGLFKENYRHQLGLKFLPIEPPRPTPTNQEAYARRPFTFRTRSPGLEGPSGGSLTPPPNSRRSSRFGRKASSVSLATNGNSSSTDQPPSIEISARLPHPSILTCNKPIPLRVLAKKLVDSSAECYLVSIQIDLVGSTIVRCQDLVNTEETRWVIVSRTDIAVPLQRGPNDAVGAETEINKVLWDNKPLPNTVMPSFVTCNLKRSYALELKLGISWGKPPGATTAIPDDIASLSSKASALSIKKNKGKGKNAAPVLAQTIFLPLHFSNVQVFSGLTPPESLAQAAMKARKQQTHTTQPSSSSQAQSPRPRPSPRPNAAASQSAPTLPPRHDPLYPPQLRPGQRPAQAAVATSSVGGGAESVFEAPPTYDEAPPSYDEAMAEAMPGPAVAAQNRPAYSGVTNENAPDSLPEKGS
ncbi:hypothetical protein N0V82_003729 [Gnomoniopsis sp. IMI 355080]|nr:hypothetical protein N0V82_003729 [Gnomoniopsis sp. IMI 355080]